jgi:hypothetical protein
LTWLFDVNVLMAIADTEHPFHRSIHGWLGRHKNIIWASCPITENGFVRIVSQPNFRGTRRTPSEAVGFLRSMKASASGSHVFWADDCSISDSDAVIHERLVVPSQITDVYLAALALRHGGKLVTFDRGIPWQCVRGGSVDLIEIPPSVV